MTTQVIAGLVATMVFSAFFSGMEIAFVSSNRLLAEMDRGKNGLAQRSIRFFYKHSNDFVSTMLVGNNVALVIYGILFAQLFDATLFSGLGDGERVMADTILSTVVVLFTGEFIPKSVFKSNPNTMLTFFAPAAMVCYIVLYPVSRLATLLSKGMLRIAGIKTKSTSNDGEFTKIDLDYLVQSSIDNAGDNEQIDDEVKIFQNALDLGDTKVRDCMIPRTEIDGVDIDECTLEELKNRFIESGYSKLIVYKGDIDHIVGYIHSSEMFHAPEEWKKNILPLSFVPETMAADKLMHSLLQQKRTIAVVVDEFGGTSGIVTLEDIVEEIFGDIEDEHDSNSYIAKKTEKGDYVLSARLEIAKVNEMFDLDLPESDEYMTVGGLILNAYQSFPKLNEKVKIGRYEFQIIKSTMTKIELVKLKISD